MDYQTLLAVLIGVYCLQAMALIITWYQSRNEDGTREWAAGGVCMAAGALVVLIASTIAHGEEIGQRMVPVTSAGIALIATGWLFLWAGIRRFVNHLDFSSHYLGLFFVLFYILLLQQQFFTLPLGWIVFCLATVVAIASSLILAELMVSRERASLISQFMMLCFGLTALLWGGRAALALLDMARPLGTLFDGLLMYQAVLVTVAVTLGMILMTTERVQKHLREQASIDSLTGLYNRRAFHDVSRAVIAAAERDKQPVALALLDLDHFKSINDTFGHGVGDKVLMRFANLAELTFRDQDILARFGGEEFVVLLSGADADQAMRALQRLRQRLETECIEYQGVCVPSTVSIGVSCRRRGKIDLHAMLEEADKALYDAKRAGRNQVIMYHLGDAVPAI